MPLKIKKKFHHPQIKIPFELCEKNHLLCEVTIIIVNPKQVERFLIIIFRLIIVFISAKH
jgi:hypothetical protein